MSSGDLTAPWNVGEMLVVDRPSTASGCCPFSPVRFWAAVTFFPAFLALRSVAFVSFRRTRSNSSL